MDMVLMVILTYVLKQALMTRDCIQNRLSLKVWGYKCTHHIQ